MANCSAKPEMMKKINLSLLFQTLVELGSATRSELVSITQISTTTIRSLLEELLHQEEIIELTLDASSGGRRAQRYTLNTKKNRILSLFYDENTCFYQIHDLLGNRTEENSFPLFPHQPEKSIQECIDACSQRQHIGAIGLGVSGIVEKKTCLTYEGSDHWNCNKIGETIQKQLSVPVLLENDLNAIAYGYALHCSHSHPKDNPENLNMIYLHFNKKCTGSGIIANGKIIRGHQNFAGELGFLPLESGKTLDMLLQDTRNLQEYQQIIAKAVSILCCTLNPAFLVIGGDADPVPFLEADAIKKSLFQTIPGRLVPEIQICLDYKNDYLSGLFYLTRQKFLAEKWVVPSDLS